MFCVFALKKCLKDSPLCNPETNNFVPSEQAIIFLVRKNMTLPETFSRQIVPQFSQIVQLKILSWTTWTFYLSLTSM